MAIKDIIDMDHDALIRLSRKENISEFRSTVREMINVSNKRITRLLKSEIGEFSPAYQKLVDAGITKFSTKGLYKADTSDLLHQYSVLKKFLTSKTSTISGWNRVRSAVGKRIGAKGLFQKTYKSKRSAKYWMNRENKFWKTYNKLVDEYGGIISQLDSDRIQKVLYKIQNMKNMPHDDETIMEIMEKFIGESYLSAQTGVDVDLLEFEDEIRINYGIK